MYLFGQHLTKWYNQCKLEEVQFPVEWRHWNTYWSRGFTLRIPWWIVNKVFMKESKKNLYKWLLLSVSFLKRINTIEFIKKISERQWVHIYAKDCEKCQFIKWQSNNNKKICLTIMENTSNIPILTIQYFW